MNLELFLPIFMCERKWMRCSAINLGSTRVLACWFRRPRRNHLRTTSESVSGALTDAREGACAPRSDPQRDSFTKGPSDVLDYATSEIAIGSKLGIDATKKLPSEAFKRPWPPLIGMDEAVKAKVGRRFNNYKAS